MIAVYDEFRRVDRMENNTNQRDGNETASPETRVLGIWMTTTKNKENRRSKLQSKTAPCDSSRSRPHGQAFMGVVQRQ